MSSVVIAGDVSGSVTLQAPSAAGSTVINLPTISGGTFVVTDSSGNVGIGTTPSAWGAGLKAIQLGGSSNTYVISNGANLQLGVNFYNNGVGNLFVANGYAPIYVQEKTGGQHQWYTTNSGTAGGTVSVTQAMTLNASGNLGIGTSTPSQKLEVSTNANSQQWVGLRNLNAGSSASTGILFGNDGNNAYGSMFVGSSTYTSFGGANAINLGSYGAYPTVFFTNNAEAMRIDSSGNVLVGRTTLPANSGLLNVNGNIAWGTSGSGRIYADVNWQMLFQGSGVGGIEYGFLNAAGTERMRITSNGGISFGSSGTGYGSSGQVLQSNGDAAPTWINQSSITSGACTGNAASASYAYQLKGYGSTSNWDTQFQNTLTSAETQMDLNSGTNCPTGGGWWFANSYRHSNGASYWGLQYAHGWEDRANQRWTRNVSNNTFDTWRLDVGCRLWVNFNNGAIRASGNVSSVSRTGTGQYTINASYALADANYSVVGTCGSNSANSYECNINPGSTSSVVYVNTHDYGNSYVDNSWVSIAVFR